MYLLLGVLLFCIAGVFSFFGFDYYSLLYNIEADTFFFFLILPLYLFKLNSELGLQNDSIAYRYKSRAELFTQTSKKITSYSIKFIAVMLITTMVALVVFFRNDININAIENNFMMMIKLYLTLNIMSYFYVVISIFSQKEAVVYAYIGVLTEYYIGFIFLSSGRIPIMISWSFYIYGDKFFVIIILLFYLSLLRTLASIIFQRKDYL